METGESSGTTQVTTIIKEDGKVKIPKKEVPTCKNGERNSERYIPSDNIPRASITTQGAWLELEKTT